MNGKRLIPGYIHNRLLKTTIVHLICAALAIGFAGCGEDGVEPQSTGVTGTIQPPGITATVKVTKGEVVVTSTDVDTEGNYEIVELSEGEYDLVVIADGYTSHSQKVMVVKGQITEVAAVTLKKAEKRPSIVTMTGKVIDSETSEPIADARVLVDYENNDMDTFTYTKKDGSFSVDIQPDLFPSVVISKAGYESSEIFAASVSKVVVSLSKPSTVPILQPQLPVETQVLKVGDLAPDFTLPKLGGGTLSLKDTRGEVVLLNFWATWCGFCKSAIPHLQNFYGKYKPQGLLVLGIDVWETGGIDAIKKLKDDMKLTYDILLGTDQGVNELYGVDAIPYTWILDRNGVIVWYHKGFGPGGEVEIEKQILAALAKP